MYSGFFLCVTVVAGRACAQRPCCLTLAEVDQMKYRPEIDGLRAVAVVPVILFHAGFQPFGGGFVGVDVFFVISGYLITSIILAEMAGGTFSLAGFYERRVRRILPALFLVIAACLPAAWILMLPGDMRDFARSVAAVSLFVSNFLFWRESGYFETAAELKPLLHTWSLAVEEQFYLLFPLLLMLLWGLGRRAIVGVVIVLAMASLALAQWAAINEPDAGFFLLPARGWELLIGGLVALFRSSGTPFAVDPRTCQIGSGVGLLLILYAVFMFGEHTPFPGFPALVPTVGAALIIVFATPSTVVGSVLASRGFVGVGLVSYSAYLWHQPLFAFARHGGALKYGEWVLGALAVVALILAYFSWRFVEQPFRDRRRFDRNRIFILAALASLTFIGIGAYGNHTKGFESYYIEHRLVGEERELYLLIRKHTEGDPDRNRVDDGRCVFATRAIDEEFERRYAACAGVFGQSLIVLGDSHAINLYNIIAKAEIDKFVVGVVRGGCRPHDDRPNCHYPEFDRFLERNAASVGALIFHQSGSYLFRDRRGNVDSWLSFRPGAPFFVDGRNIERIDAYLNRLGGLVETYWLGPFVEARVDLNDLNVLRDGLKILDQSLTNFGELEVELKSRTAAPENRYRYVSLFDILAIERDFLKVGSCITYRDKDHFSDCGEDLLAPKLKRAFESGLFTRSH